MSDATVAALHGRIVALPRLVVSDGALEALKWISLVLMTGDHVNKYLFNGTKDALFAAGRLAMPLFAFVLAYNLARATSVPCGAYARTMQRLALAGLIATPACLGLGGLTAGWWPLNIMFTLLSLTAMLRLAELRTIRGDVAAVAVFLMAGAVVEFWWPALVFGGAVWCYCKQPSWTAATAALLALCALWLVNGNLWALAAVPLAWLVGRMAPAIPRLNFVFYAYYPIHLAALWLIRIPMGHAGYLFF